MNKIDPEINDKDHCITVGAALHEIWERDWECERENAGMNGIVLVRDDLDFGKKPTFQVDDLEGR